ncbi:response regulator [Blastococcus sp. SYSU DS0619]
MSAVTDREGLRPPGVDHPSLVPALLLADSLSPGTGPAPSHRRVRRSVRDWVVDVSLFLLSLGLGLLFIAEAASRRDPPPDLLLLADLVAGTLACLLLWGRRRWPVGVALVLAAIGTFSDMAAIAVMTALFTVAVHRTWRTVAAVAAANLAALAVYVQLRPDPELPWPVFTALGVVLLAAATAWGMFVRARRQLVVSLRERAARAEAEQRLRVAQAQQLERTRIAREMHDVLAHRLSLLSMHAGALEFRPDAPAADVAAAAGVVRASARQALEDLRAVIGVLRESAEPGAVERPQPTLRELPVLVEECRRAGLRVRARYRVPELGGVPAATGRAAYRVVQEALTNVRKHAPGTVADVLVEGTAGTGLTVEVRNPLAVAGPAPPALPGSGTGLIGLLERISLAGGTLEHGWTPEGEFRLRAPPVAVPGGRRVSEEAPDVRVLVVDDDPLVRAALAMVLGGTPGLRLVGEAADGDEVPAAVAATDPDLVLMDIRMPRVDGLAATELLQAGGTGPQVIVLTTFDADDHVLRALRAGASGFLLKDTPPASIVDAVRRVADGEPMLSPTVTRQLMAHVAGAAAPRDDAGDRARALLARLSEREQEVALAVGRGLSNAGIAAELYMSVATVKAHVSRLLVKLEAANRVQVALVVHDAGLL